MTATSWARRTWRASSPPAARRTRNSAARIASRASSTRGSSSTISTVAGSTRPPGPTGPARASLRYPRRDAVPQTRDLVEGLAILDALELRRAQLAIEHALASAAEGRLRGDYMRIEQPCHALDPRRGDHRPPHHDQFPTAVGADGGGPHGPGAD